MKHHAYNTPDLSDLGFKATQFFHYQLQPEEVTKLALSRGEGLLTDNGVLTVDTGKFTGRSPKDRFIVRDHITEDLICWNDVNLAFSSLAFDRLASQMVNYLSGQEIFVRDGAAGADPDYELSLRVVTETAYQNLFAYNVFLRKISVSGNPEWTVVAAPGFRADPEEDQTRQPNFTVISFTRKLILIGGTGYTGEIKKAVFSVLNFLLPQQGVLPMHCAANSDAQGNTAIFFGLSGTGKTTLSADPERFLIGDDEHGWSQNGIFNFEGGCYAKTVDLNPEKEPQIFGAIQEGALLENICFYPGSRAVDFADTTKTENTRVSYPIEFISNAVIPSAGHAPKHIFLLAADAFGVLPPIAKLDHEQALYYFLLGYTAKVAGTEHGIVEPQATFSACFGKAFLPHPAETYANLLSSRIKETRPQVWLVNTGWSGGPYGVGNRIDLSYTRALVKAALNGELAGMNYHKLTIFDLMIPEHCTGVPDHLLDPALAWSDEYAYCQQAKRLHKLFGKNRAKQHKAVS